MRYYLFIIAIIFLASCKKTSIKIEGEVFGLKSSTLDVVYKGTNGRVTKLGTAKIDGSYVKFSSDKVKPPVKLSFIGEEEYSFWLFRYGSVNVEINKGRIVVVNNSMENSEYDRIRKNYHKMYFNQIAEKEQWVKENETLESLSEEEEEMLFNCRKDIKKAYKLRKKSILSTFRKNPQNRIAMALLFDEYERLTSWQKEECLKTAQKYYSDCGINWQLRN
jgi:hypothetical protein